MSVLRKMAKLSGLSGAAEQQQGETMSYTASSPQMVYETERL